MRFLKTPNSTDLKAPIRELGLKIAGTPLEPTIAEFRHELEQAGIDRLRPDFYLSTEWGVPFPSISIGIPFYLAHPDLVTFHSEQDGYLEGVGPLDLLRLLRHEMGHVVNYAYQLYERDDWTALFGSMSQPYHEEYTPQPFSPRHVRHLAGWYAQKHPDEDWAETFAVWLTPGFDWRSVYADAPDALAKLKFCDRVMTEIKRVDPIMADTDHDDDVSQLAMTLEEFYSRSNEGAHLPSGLSAVLSALFAELGPSKSYPEATLLSAPDLMARIEQTVITDVYRWTGHFPETTRALFRYLRSQAKERNETYPAAREAEVIIAITAFVTSLAMNHVLRGRYIP